MTMIFERDSDGLLHQTKMTLEDVSAAGRNINLMSVQQFYILFTEQEEKELAEQRAQFMKDQEEVKSAALKAQEEKNAELDALAKQAAALEQAKKEEQAAKDNALNLALQKLQELQNKVDALTAVKS
jgi:hypothetical protein